jgi:hypothetical protein
MYEVRNPKGRLVTLRLASPIDEPESARAVEDIRRVLGGVSGRARICTDLSGARTFPPEVAERFVALMKVDNPKIERSGFLIGQNATFALQIERMLRAAGSSSRLTFRAVADLTAWLSKVCDEPEQRALATFLAES